MRRAAAFVRPACRYNAGIWACVAEFVAGSGSHGPIWIKHADVVTLDEQGTILRNADLLIEGGRITQIGTVPDDTHADEIIDASGTCRAARLF